VSSDSVSPPASGGPLRPRPPERAETRFFWEGLARGELRIQQCSGCGALHHPPVARCPRDGSYALGYRVSGGRGVVYSFAQPCHPRFPGFAEPLLVALVELEEGTRLVTNLVGVAPEAVRIGMEVELVVSEVERGFWLPLFQPRRARELAPTPRG
jgi:uncharacterized OB-fold protein